MPDAADAYSHRHPNRICYGLLVVLPALGLLTVPVTFVLVEVFRCGFRIAFAIADVLWWVWPVQIGLAALSFAVGLGVLPKGGERALHQIACPASIPVVWFVLLACYIAIKVIHVP